MNDAYIYDGIRTPIGRYGGGLSSIRADDLAALPIEALISRNPEVELSAMDEVFYGCANQAGEDNRNVARMAGLLANLPKSVPGTTINRLCGSGMDAVAIAARTLKVAEAQMVLAGGVESMSRAPFVMPKSSQAFSRSAEIYDTTLGWRFVNPKMQEMYGVDSMPETAENVALRYGISREAQDAFAFRSQQRTQDALSRSIFKEEIVAVTTKVKRDEVTIDMDEFPRANTSLEGLAMLPTPFKENGTVTAGNASGMNDGACALLLGTKSVEDRFGLSPIAKIVASATAGVEPKLMGMGPVPASQKVLKATGLTLEQMDVVELNEAFAAQAIAVLRELGLDEGADKVNPNGGAISLGHPLGMSGARLILTANNQLRRIQGRYALCTMCIGVGQGIAMIIENMSL